MRFLQPDLFYAWAALLAVPLVLYLFRPRPRTVLTSTLPFFKWLAREHQDNAWLRRLKQLLSLLMTLAVIAAGAASLGQLVVSPAEDELKTVVVLVDRSASMAAQRDGEPSCNERAISFLRERLAGLSAGVGVSVIAYDRRPEVLLATTIDRREVYRTLDSIEVRPVAGQAKPALRLATRLAALETPAAIWHVTDYEPEAMSADDEGSRQEGSLSEDDGEDSDSAQLVAGRDVDVQNFYMGLSKPVNAGITAFRLTRVPLQQARLGYEAFVQVRASGEEPLPAELEVRRQGQLVQLRKLTIQPGGVETLLIPLEAAAAVRESNRDGEAAVTTDEAEKASLGHHDGTLSLKLNVEGDVLATDDEVHSWIPELQPIRVLWLSEEPNAFMQLAFSTITGSQDIQMLQGAPSAWPPKEPVDVVIFDGWVPDEWPTDVEVIAIQPPRSVGPIEAISVSGGGVPVDRIRVAESQHPLLYGVATERISVRQKVVLDAKGPLQPLWAGPSGPLLVAGESQGQRVLATAFRPEDSERFPLMTSFPIFLANSVYWAAENRMQRTLGNGRQTGEIVHVEGEAIAWITPGDHQDSESSRESVMLSGEWNELDRVGLWESSDGLRGSAAMLSETETMLPVDSDVDDIATGSNDGDSSFSSLLRGDLVPLLMWSMLVILLLESWLYHRHAV